MALGMLWALPYETWSSEVIAAALLAAGLCFTFVYLATLVAILACHFDEI